MNKELLQLNKSLHYKIGEQEDVIEYLKSFGSQGAEGSNGRPGSPNP